MQKIEKGFITGRFDIEKKDIGSNELGFFFNSICDIIKQEDLYEPENGYGIEDNPHVTLLGHIDIDTENNKDIIEEQTLYYSIPYAVAVKVVLSGISCFVNENFNVLKFNVVRNNGLIELHNHLDSRIRTTSPFKTFVPHLTIAYLKKDCDISMYIEKVFNFYLENTKKDIELSFSSLRYKSPYGVFGYNTDYTSLSI
jgi:2'-5' RNA ligase